MKLAVAALIRNEIDIIGTFLQHLDALFDHAVLMDHGSIDGTDRMLQAACDRHPGWSMWRLEPVGYHQVAFSEFVLRHLLQHTDADFVIFLDADEFIDVPERAALESAVSGLADPPRPGHLSWRNAVPDRFDTRAINPGDAVWLVPNAMRRGKVVIPRAFYAAQADTLELSMGNHFFYHRQGYVVPSDRVADILHLPVRSHTQLRSKVMAGVLAVMAQANRYPDQSWHWHDILWRIGEGTLRDEDLIGIAVHYSEKGHLTSKPTSWDELVAQGFRPTRLNVAFGRALPTPTDSLSLDPMRLFATTLRRLQLEDPRSSQLVLDGNRLRFTQQVTPA